MTRASRLFLSVLVTIASTLGASRLHSQACHGTPSGLAVAYQYGTINFGSAQGASINSAGSRIAFGGTYRYREIHSDITGHEGRVQLALLFGVSRVMICPTVAIGFRRDSWEEPSQGLKLTANVLTPRAGVGIGTEYEVFRGFSVIPFVSGEYVFEATGIELESEGDDEVQVTGDTISRGDLAWGISGHYKMVYAGFISNNDFKGLAEPYMVRWVLGVSLGGGSRSSRSQVLSSRAHGGLSRRGGR